jgi:hypothetical protein
MITREEASNMSEQELLDRQRKGAKKTATIVGLIAFGIFMLTLYLNLKN